MKYKMFFRNATLLIGSAITIMAGSVIAPALPKISLYFQNIANADFLVKQLVTIPSLFIAITSPFVGILSDRWGRKPVLIFSLILYGFSGITGYFWDSLYAIIVSRALIGVAVAGVLNGLILLISDYFSGSKLDKFMGLQLSFMGLGSSVFLIVSGVLADIGWRYPFLIYLIAFLILPGVLFFISEPEKIDLVENIDKDNLNESFLIKKLFLLFALAFIGITIIYTVPVYLPFYFQVMENISAAKIGMAISIMALVGAFVSMKYHIIKRYLSFKAIFAVHFFTVGIGFLIIAVASLYYQTIIGLIVLGLGAGLLVPNLTLLVISLVSSAVKGRAIGALITCILAAQFFSPIIMGQIVKHVGIAGIFGIAAIASFILSVLIQFVLKIKSFEE